MNHRNPNRQILFILAAVLLVKESLECLDPSEESDECTSCEGGEVLIKGQCFTRMKGCLQYGLSSKELKCQKCQNGYDFWEDGCERTGVIELLRGQVKNEKDFQTPPIKIAQPGHLTKEEIFKNSNGTYHESQDKQKGSKQTQYSNIKNQVTFPEFNHQDPKAVWRQLSLNGSALGQLPEELAMKIMGENPEVKDIPILNLHKQNQCWLIIYQNGALIIANKIVSNIAEGVQNYGSSQTQSDSITSNQFDGQSYEIKKMDILSMKSKNFYDALDHGLVEGVKGINRASLSLNLDLELQNSNTSINLDLLTGKINILQDPNQDTPNPQTRQIINKLIKNNEIDDDELLQYFNIAYAQYQQKIKVSNVPPTIEKALIRKIDEDLVFKVEYKQTQTATESEYAIIRYNIRKNVTEVAGYYVEETNLLEESAEQLSKYPDTKLPKPTQNISMVIKRLLKEDDFKQLVQNGYFKVSFEGQTTSYDQIIYQIKILVPQGLYLVFLRQNTTAESFSHQIEPLGGPSCLQLPTNNSEVKKIITYLRNTFVNLKNYDELAVNLKIKESEFHYTLIFSNKKFEKLRFRIKKDKGSHFSIQESKILQSGFGFPSQIFKNGSFTIRQIIENRTDFSEQFAPFLPSIREASIRFSGYLKGAIISSILKNDTHCKIYIETLKAIYQYSQELPQNTAPIKSGTLKLIYSKIRKRDILPPHFQSENMLSRQDETKDLLEELQTAFYARFKFYLGNGDYEYYTQRVPSNSDVIEEYEMVIESITGCYRTTITRSSSGYISFGYLQSIDPWYLNKDPIECKQGQILDSIEQICHRRIISCDKQIEKMCLMCHIGTEVSPDASQCVRSCMEV